MVCKLLHSVSNLAKDHHHSESNLFDATNQQPLRTSLLKSLSSSSAPLLSSANGLDCLARVHLKRVCVGTVTLTWDGICHGHKRRMEGRRDPPYSMISHNSRQAKSSHHLTKSIVGCAEPESKHRGKTWKPKPRTGINIFILGLKTTINDRNGRLK